MCRDPPSRLERRSRTIGSASWRPTKLTTNSVTCSDTKLYTDNAHDQPNYTPCVSPLSTRPVRGSSREPRDLFFTRARCEPYTPSGPSAMPSRPCAPHARIGITNSISMRNIINRDPTYDYLRPLRARPPYKEFSYTYCQNCVCCGCMKMLPHAAPAVDCRPPRVELSQSATACRTMDDAFSEDRHGNLLAARRAF